MAELPERSALVWQPYGWIGAAEQRPLRRALLSDGIYRAVESRLRDPLRARRAESAAADRFALHVALDRLFGRREAGSGNLKPPPSPRTSGGLGTLPQYWGSSRKTEQEPSPLTSHLSPNSAYLFHTRLGAPKIALRGAGAQWARENGLERGELHISFTHDGQAHVALACRAQGLRGVGLDLVHLPRLRAETRGRDYLLRFARQFMSDVELAVFEAASAEEDARATALRVAAHFSLMESASKALGTGLKIGGGMGKAESLPKRSIGVLRHSPHVLFTLGAEAVARMDRLRASRLEGRCAADGEYLLSAALLWE